MFEVLEKRPLNGSVTLLRFFAPRIAKKAKAGQFVILRAGENSERIPLTIAGTGEADVTVIFLVVGGATMELDRKRVGDRLEDVAGPLGNPTDLAGVGRAVVVGGGVGCAIALPIARELRRRGASVTSIIGFKSKELVILEEEFRAVSDSLFLTTDDGSYGERGNVCMPLSRLLESGEKPDRVFAIGPLPMMKYVAETTRGYAVKTVASMNPIMIDGTGMCGCCRITVGGVTKFACVDGPDFDAHLVDFDEAISRSRTYAAFETEARERRCRLYKGVRK